MHDRAAEPIGPTTSPTAIATEIMILLSIEVRIAQVRLPVEEKRSALSSVNKTKTLAGFLRRGSRSILAWAAISYSTCSDNIFRCPCNNQPRATLLSPYRWRPQKSQL